MNEVSLPAGVRILAPVEMVEAHRGVPVRCRNWRWSVVPGSAQQKIIDQEHDMLMRVCLAYSCAAALLLGSQRLLRWLAALAGWDKFERSSGHHLTLRMYVALPKAPKNPLETQRGMTPALGHMQACCCVAGASIYRVGIWYRARLPDCASLVARTMIAAGERGCTANEVAARWR